MSNPIKGELAFEHDGKSYTFVFGTYAQAALERMVGVSMFKFFARDRDDWGTAELLGIFRSGLLRHHKMSEEEVADLMDAMGPKEVQKVIAEGLNLAFPKAKEAAKGGSRPPKNAA